jgi:hypothetical protein
VEEVRWLERVRADATVGGGGMDYYLRVGIRVHLLHRVAIGQVVLGATWGRQVLNAGGPELLADCGT